MSVLRTLTAVIIIYVIYVCSQFSGKNPNKHTRVSAKANPGFLERLSETAGGTVVGIGLFFLSLYVLFTNEVKEKLWKCL